MDIAADREGAGLVERVGQRPARFLQAEVLVVPGPEYVDVVDDVVLVGEDDPVALRQVTDDFVECQPMLGHRDGGRRPRADDGPHQAGEGGGERKANGHGDPHIETDRRGFQNFTAVQRLK